MTHSLWTGTLKELVTLFPSRILFCMEKALRANWKEFPKAFPVKLQSKHTIIVHLCKWSYKPVKNTLTLLETKLSCNKARIVLLYDLLLHYSVVPVTENFNLCHAYEKKQQARNMRTMKLQKSQRARGSKLNHNFLKNIGLCLKSTLAVIICQTKHKLSSQGNRSIK